MNPVMINFEAAIRTTVLLVDHDVRTLHRRAEVMKMSGFSVHTAASAIEALAILRDPNFGTIDVVVLDYDLPGINGCILAEYIKSRYPEIVTVLYAEYLDTPEDGMRCLDALISKLDGIGALIAKIAELRQIEAFDSKMFIVQDQVRIGAELDFC